MPKYTDEVRAAVYAALVANEWNVARSAKDVGVPEQTVRDWARLWKKEPPQFSPELLNHANEEFAVRAERLRDKLLAKYEEAVDNGEVKADKFPVTIGILDDKVRLHRGQATSRTETVSLPNPREIREMFRGIAIGAIEAAQRREQDIIDVDLDEQSVKELGPGS